MLHKIGAWLWREKMLLLSLAAALQSMLFVPPDAAYAGYVDWDVLLLLFSLMAVVTGLKRCGVFGRLAAALLHRAGDLRRLTRLLALGCFFSSMLVTNDVALLTFVPLTALLLQGQGAALIYAVSLESVAANLGSMATPVGNPQNLYLFSHYAMSLGDFCAAVLPLCAASLALVLLACLPVPKSPLDAPSMPAETPAAAPRWRLALHALQFVCCLLAVLRVLPKPVCFGLVLLSTLLADRKALAQVDYALLGTFVCFFVFVGNLGRIPAVQTLLTGVVAGRELETALLVSQVVSNVPAALMLSGFTDHAAALMRGVDIGGLGTLVASLASLIAFKLYMKTPGAKAGRYLWVFTLMNAAFLLALYGLSQVI